MPTESDHPATVAIVIPTYNRARLVGRAIDSALAQPGATQVIVVDDGSTDDTPERLRRYRDEPRMTLLRHEHNRGVTAAKNSGLAALPERVTWFGILDSDDTLTPGALEALLAAGAQHGDEVSQLIGWCEDASSGAPTGVMTHRCGPVSYDDALCARFTGEFWHLARRDLLGDLRFEERAGGGEASLWWILLRSRPAWLIDDVVRRYDRSGLDRIGIASYSSEDARRRMWAYRAVLDAVGDDMLQRCPEHYAELTGEMAKWASLCGDRRTARRGAWLALRHRPGIRPLLLNLLAYAPIAVARRAARRVARRRAQGAASPPPVSSR